MGENLIDRIRAASTLLPKKQRQICSYIDANSLEASSLTVAGLSKRIGVSTTTVIRLFKSLGYDSYTTFKRDLLHAIISSGGDAYSVYWDLQEKRINARMGSNSKPYATVLSEMETLFHKLSNPHFFAQLDTAVEAILSANRIFILGLRSSKVIAFNLYYLLKRHLDNVYQLSDESEYVIDNIARMKQQDLLIAITVHPYVKKTADMVRLCHKLGIPVVLITSSQNNHPLTSISRVVILVGETDSLLILMPLILVTQLLALEIGRRMEGQGQNSLQRLDRILGENHLMIWENN